MYPYFSLGKGNIFSGYDSLAAWMIAQKRVMIDGYGGNDWKTIRSRLSEYFDARHIRVCWYETASFQKPVEEISEMVNPFLGEPDLYGVPAPLYHSMIFMIAAL